MQDKFTKIGGTKIAFAVTLCALAFILTLNKSQATKCEADGCYFNFGFIISRKPSCGALSTPVISAIVRAGVGLYRAPPWIQSRVGNKVVRSRVIAFDSAGNEVAQTDWRTLKFDDVGAVRQPTKTS